MDNTVLVACETLKRELEASVEETKDKLDNENNNVERVLLAFGFCGVRAK